MKSYPFFAEKKTTASKEANIYLKERNNEDIQEVSLIKLKDLEIEFNEAQKRSSKLAQLTKQATENRTAAEKKRVETNQILNAVKTDYNTAKEYLLQSETQAKNSSVGLNNVKVDYEKIINQKELVESKLKTATDHLKQVEAHYDTAINNKAKAYEKLHNAATELIKANNNYYFAISKEQNIKVEHYYYSELVATKQARAKILGLINDNPYYTHHYETRFNQSQYNKDITDARNETNYYKLQIDQFKLFKQQALANVNAHEQLVTSCKDQVLKHCEQKNIAHQSLEQAEHRVNYYKIKVEKKIKKLENALKHFEKLEYQANYWQELLEENIKQQRYAEENFIEAKNIEKLSCNQYENSHIQFINTKNELELGSDQYMNGLKAYASDYKEFNIDNESFFNNFDHGSFVIGDQYCVD